MVVLVPLEEVREARAARERQGVSMRERREGEASSRLVSMSSLQQSISAESTGGDSDASCGDRAGDDGGSYALLKGSGKDKERSFDVGGGEGVGSLTRTSRVMASLPPPSSSPPPSPSPSPSSPSSSIMTTTQPTTPIVTHQQAPTPVIDYSSPGSLAGQDHSSYRHNHT